MKRLIFFLALLLTLATIGNSQTRREPKLEGYIGPNGTFHSVLEMSFMPDSQSLIAKYLPMYAAAPDCARRGQLYYNTATDKMQLCTVTGSPGTWSDVATGSAGTTINPTNGVLPYRVDATNFGDSPITRTDANTITLPSAGVLVYSTRSKISSSADGILVLNDNAGTSFSRLALGGTTSSFPALARNNAQLRAVLADNSALAAMAVGSLVLADLSSINNSSDGVLKLSDSAGTSFGRLQFGGTTSSFPSIKRNSTALNFRLADDSADAPVTALDGTFSGWVKPGANNTCFLAADQTNATTTFANVNNCTINVVSGQKYSFKAILFMADSTAADGAKLDFNGGAATVTNFRVHCQLVNDTGGATALAAAASTTLAGVLNATAMSTTNQHEFRCDGTFEPSSTNTFIPRMAQNAHSTGTLTLQRGSNIVFDLH
jgi:hypothetical protein